MSRKLASIQKVVNVQPIENADAIEMIQVLGWELVAKKGSFKVGDLCVYFEIDSILPETEWSEFMRPRGFRIKTIKLRGQVSMGLALPISILKDYGNLEQVGEDYYFTKNLTII
jgi:RNA ligase (TIGR02306 family)